MKKVTLNHTDEHCEFIFSPVALTSQDDNTYFISDSVEFFTLSVDTDADRTSYELRSYQNGYNSLEETGYSFCNYEGESALLRIDEIFNQFEDEGYRLYA